MIRRLASLKEWPYRGRKGMRPRLSVGMNGETGESEIMKGVPKVDAKLIYLIDTNMS